MNKVLLLLLFTVPVAVNSQIKVYNAGQAFSCISIDSNYNVWAGTNKAGLFLLAKKSNSAATQFDNVATGTFSTKNIQTIATDGYSNVWVGHNGTGGSFAGGGGIEQVDMNNPATIKHYSPDRNAECYTFLARNGLATLNSASIAVDKNGTVWSAHKYHDVTIASSPGSPAKYILTPGALSYKFSSSVDFFSKGTYDSYKNGLDPELPYPAYTCDPPISKTPGSRNTYAVAYGSNEVWLSVAAYEAKGGGFIPARLIRYNLGGTFIGVFNMKDIGLPAAGVFNNIYITAKGKVWVSTTLGRVAYYDGSNWYPVTFPASFPATLRLNANAITGDKLGNVYMGTNSGLVVCNANPRNAKSSYKIYTAADGLPSANVTGVVAEKNGTVWLATDAGIAKYSPPSFAVYNLINPVKGDELNADKFQLVSADKKDLQINGMPIEINVAADSSSSTLIVYNGSSPETKEITLVSTPVGNDPYSPETGKFKEILRSKDSLVYLYQHPNYVLAGDSKKFITYSMGLKDKNTGDYAIQGKLNVYHVPVLLVHGVWSSVSSMKDVKTYLQNNSSNYESYQLLSIWYPTSDHEEARYSVQQYRNEIPKGIDELLQECRENFISAGKVNIVGHSRGGLFARYYLQNTFEDYPYRNDINSLITVNSPHFGAQTANLVLDKRKVAGLEVGKTLGPLFLSNPERPKGDDINGAYELRVNDHAIVNTLNGPPYLNGNIVPSHAIVTEYKFGVSKADILKDALVYGGMPLFLRMYVLQMGTACLEGSVDNCVKEIFDKETNDVVVPLSSQKGGLEDKAVSLLKGNFGHSPKNALGGIVNVPGVTYQIETHERIAELLRQNPNIESSSFSKKGYHPGAPLKYTFLPGLAGNPDAGRTGATQSTLLIDTLLKDKTFKPLDTVIVGVTGSTDIKTLLTAYSSLSLKEPSSDLAANSSNTFKYIIPKEAAGRVSIVAYGFADDGLLAVDSSYINIGLPANVTLDSIKIQKEGDRLLVPAKDSIPLTITGYYSDTVRRITYLPGISYSFITGGLAATSSPNYLIGITPGGIDQIKVNYLGAADSSVVQVTDSVPYLLPDQTLPVNFKSFTGEYKNRKVQLHWTVAGEKDSKQFEVQYSADGVHFETIDIVAAKGNGSGTNVYFYPSFKFKSGKNYYRLKQVDMDGNYQFSAVVLLSLDNVSQSSISFYPNPATNIITLRLNQPAVESLVLQLTDITGRRLWYKTVAGNVTSIPVMLPRLLKGMYIVTIVNNKGEKLLTDKLIIE